MTSSSAPILIEHPVAIMYEDPSGSGKIRCCIHRGSGSRPYPEYGLMICDLVRHVARAFKVPEDDVWHWVDRERRRPTTQISEIS